MFDGSADENWTSRGENRVAIQVADMKTLSKSWETGNALCNSFVQINRDGNYTDNRFSLDTINTIWFCSSEYAATVETWRSRLQSNPTTVYYESTTPTWEELPEEYQNVLDNLQTYNGATYISVDSKVKPVVTSKYGTSEVGARALTNTNRIEKHEEECDQRFDLLEIQTGDQYEIHGTKPGGYRLLNVDGNTEQKTVNGYQLFNASRLVTKSAGGATVTNNGDGSFTISGSGEMTAGLAIDYSLTHEETIALLKAGPIHLKVEANTIPYAFVDLIQNGTRVLTLISNADGTITQDFLNDPTSYIKIGIYGASGRTISTGTIKPMLYQDGDGTWEPFVGATPSPNSAYPQSINNTFDCVEMISGAHNSSDGVFNPTHKTFITHKHKIPCKGGDTIEIRVDNNIVDRISLLYYNENGFLSFTDEYKNTMGRVVPNGVTHFKVDIGDDKLITPQTVGKITLTINGKHVAQFVEHGKNLFDISIEPSTENTIIACNITEPITISAVDNSVVVSEVVWRVSVTYKDGTIGYIGDKGYGDGSFPKTFNASENNPIIKLSYRGGKTITSGKYSVQTEIGTVATPYEPYKGKIATVLLNEPLHATDRLVRKDGVIGIDRRSYKIVFNGTENFADDGQKNGLYVYGLNLYGTYAKKLSLDYDYLCTHFITSTDYYGNAKQVCIYTSSWSTDTNSATWIEFATNFKTLAEFKSFVAEQHANGTPVTVEFAEAGSTFTPLDLESQKALNSLETFKDVTYLEVDSRTKPAGVKGEFGMSGVVAYTLKALLNTETLLAASMANAASVAEPIVASEE